MKLPYQDDAGWMQRYTDDQAFGRQEKLSRMSREHKLWRECCEANREHCFYSAPFFISAFCSAMLRAVEIFS